MGLLKLLTFPVSAPVSGAQWILQTLRDEAERQYHDPAAIRRQMADLESDRRAGRISDDEFDRREEALLERLLQARQFHQNRG
jgi:hypothetical protein